MILRKNKEGEEFSEDSIRKLRDRFGDINPFDRPQYFTKNMNNPSARFPDKIDNMKYFIEHPETQYWLTKEGAVVITVLHSKPSFDYWTKDPLKAFKFNEKSHADYFLKTAIKDELLNKEFIVTEHKFVPTKTSKSSNN